MNDILYVVKIKIDDSVADEWKQWMQETHIPDILDTGLFRSAVLLEDRLVSPNGGRHFETHYRTTESELEEYHNNHATRLQSDHITRYKDKFEAERHILTLQSTQTHS